MINGQSRHIALSLALLAAGHLNAMDVPSASQARVAGSPVDYRLRADLDPAAHSISGSARILLPSPIDEVIITLHRDVKLINAEVGGGKLVEIVRGDTTPTSTSLTTSHTIRLTPEVERPELRLTWGGTLYQDASKTEVAGEIHNQAVRATIGTEGVYLADGWYPKVRGWDMGNYELSLNNPSPLTLVASGEYDSTTSQRTRRNVWFSRYPLENLVIVGGNHEVHRDHWRGLDIEIHLKPSQREHAAGLKASVRRYLDRYETLLGPFPNRQYRVVDNFFSSGFAFPGFTLLSSAVIDMGEVSRSSHGYIDHEFVHSWFGTGVQADDRLGNWSEALTSFATNYYGYILDGEPQGARKYRRDALIALSKLSPSRDVPLAWFGNRPDVSRSIGYNKGAVAFSVLEREIGSDAFWRGLRQFTYWNIGRQATWRELQNAFERASGQDLTWFINQWVYQPGLIDLRVDKAIWSEKKQSLQLKLKTASPFRAKVPVVIVSSGTSVTIEANLTSGSQRLTVADVKERPGSVIIDPNYETLRRLPPTDWVPTLDSTKRASSVVTFAAPSDRELAAPYFELFAQRTGAGQFRQGQASTATKLITADDLSKASDKVADAGALLVGNEAVWSAAGQHLLAQVNQGPVHFLPDGFAVGSTEYRSKSQALLATFRHPQLPGVGVTVIVANGPDAWPKSTNLPFYPNSIVVFDNRKPVYREDLEHHDIIPVNNE